MRGKTRRVNIEAVEQNRVRDAKGRRGLTSEELELLVIGRVIQFKEEADESGKPLRGIRKALVDGVDWVSMDPGTRVAAREWVRVFDENGGVLK